MVNEEKLLHMSVEAYYAKLDTWLKEQRAKEEAYARKG